MTERTLQLLTELQPIIKEKLGKVKDGDKVYFGDTVVTYCEDCMNMDMYTQDFVREVVNNTIFRVPKFIDLWTMVEWEDLSIKVFPNGNMRISGDDFVIDPQDPYTCLLTLLDIQNFPE